jgi:magnesium chelatase family protein
MFVRTYGAAFRGVEVTPLTIEIRMDRGIQFQVAGLSAKSAQDCLLRIRGAWKQLGIAWPRQAVTISVSPALPPGAEWGLDLPIALGLLGAMEQLPPSLLGRICAAGEIRLDGSLAGSPGLISSAFAAREAGCDVLLLPDSIGPEAAGLEPQVAVFGASTLPEIIEHLQGVRILPRLMRRNDAPLPTAEVKLEDLQLSTHARTTLIVAAAGNHHLLMIGPPGTGKSVMARCLHGLLPPLTIPHAAEVKRIHAAKGLARKHDRLPPFRSPHTGMGTAAMLGSRPGANAAQGLCTPGELSLAHRGVLCLDEFPEFPRSVIEGLRQPLETRCVDVARAGVSASMPADTLVVATANPCPCGYFGEGESRCQCTPVQVRNYARRLSGPIMDRFDLHYETVDSPLISMETHPGPWPRSTEAAIALVAQVRNWMQTGPQSLLLARTPLILPETHAHLHMMVRHFGLTSRGKSKLLHIARTLSLIENQGWQPLTPEILEKAMLWRLFDRKDRHIPGPASAPSQTENAQYLSPQT